MTVSTLQALVALDGEIDRGWVDGLVAGDAGIGVLDYIDVGGPTASHYGAGDILLVACSEYSRQVSGYISEAVRQHAVRPVVLLCPPQSNGFLAEAFASGVDDVITATPTGLGSQDPELAQQLQFVLEKAVARKRGDAISSSTDQGQLICILGLKGGSGKTLTTANLGVALAAAGRSVAMIDLDLQFGDLALALGLRPERTIYDLVRSGGSLDAEKLGDFLVEHSSGARGLLAPVRPDQAAVVTVPFLREVIRLLRATHEFVLVDTPPNFTPEVISVVDSGSDVLMVAMRDTLSLKNAKLGLDTLERMEFDRRRVRIVLNRANTNVGIERQDILAILGRDVDVLVPSHRDVTRAMNQGVAVATQRASGAGKAFRSLADMYIADREGLAGGKAAQHNGSTRARSGRSSLFGRLFSRTA